MRGVPEIPELARHPTYRSTTAIAAAADHHAARRCSRGANGIRSASSNGCATAVSFDAAADKVRMAITPTRAPDDRRSLNTTTAEISTKEVSIRSNTPDAHATVSTENGAARNSNAALQARCGDSC